jgi:hypothetical protein
VDARGLERNLRLYQWYLPLSRVNFWSPVFFLFFNARFPIDRVLQLEAVYYLAVVAIEIPSGYLSDRVGRAVTLRLSAAGFSAAFLLFLLGGASFVAFAAAQVSLAFGYASRSGTDESFHFDSLLAQRREHEFAAREALLSRNGYLAASASAVLGGAVALADLRLAYLLGFALSLVTLGVTLGMREPPREASGWDAAPFAPQLRRCVAFLRRPLLAWLFAFVVLRTTLEHVPYEFAQPYLAAVLGESAASVARTPLVSGVVTAGYALVAALAAARSMRLRDRFGVGGTLLGLTAFQTLLIGAMAAVVHPLVVGLLLFRSSLSAVSSVVVNAAVAPLVPAAQRATYLSLHSLAGRLGYAAVLAGLSLLVEPGFRGDPEAVARMLRWCTGLALAGLLGLTLARRAVAPPG